MNTGLRTGISLLVCAAVLVAAGLRPAYAISQVNRENLEKYFRSKGEVSYELYAPFGGPEVGIAVYESGGTARMEVAQLLGKNGKGKATTLLSETLMGPPARPPFTFLLSGAHLLTYTTKPFTDAYGSPGVIGDMVIRDLTGKEGPKVVFELRDVANLQFQPGSDAYGESVIWQTQPCFLNSAGRLPVKHSYARLVYNLETGNYELRQPLAALPDASTDDSANDNNRAIIHYRLGRLGNASALLEDAVITAEYNQSSVVRNKSLVDSEIEDFARQSNVPGRAFDEALMYFYQGQYKACLRELENRKSVGYGPVDYGMMGLALAHERRWPQADRCTEVLLQNKAPFVAEYLAMLVEIARYQGFPDIASSQLRRLEAVAPKSPEFAAELATLLIETGDEPGAERVLERCLNSNTINTSSLSSSRRVLYGLYQGRAYFDGCRDLIRASATPLLDLAGYVDLLDFQDLSSALKGVELEQRDRIVAPDEPLDGLVLQDQNPNAPDLSGQSSGGGD
ncbi:hypothetical protein IT575_06010 [bacterium]|nr:hypothetical protein [bacterium]